MFAIVSDIHGNLEALLAVLADIETRHVDGILCLGDTVGYGPNPVECVETAMSWPLVLAGDHDWAVTHCREAEQRFAVALISQFRWAHQAFQQTERGRRCLKWLGNLPRLHIDGRTLYVHGSPRDGIHEYLFPEDIYNQKKLADIASRFDLLCFCGHTHIPGVIAKDGDEWQYIMPADCDGVYRIVREKTIVNVGSVGQPRDSDARAGYVLYDGECVQFRRVDYDIETTQRKIRDLPDLDDSSGERLNWGR